MKPHDIKQVESKGTFYCGGCYYFENNLDCKEDCERDTIWVKGDQSETV